MIRMTRLTDYGIVLLTRMARLESTAVHNARDLAGAARLPLPTVNKVLKTLTRKGFLTSHRGVKGGYRLARAAEEISVLDVVTATDDRAGVSNDLYRVRGVEEVYDTTKDPLIYRQKVILGAR